MATLKRCKQTSGWLLLKFICEFWGFFITSFLLSTSEKLDKFHVQVAEFQLGDTVKIYFTGAFQTFYTETRNSHSKTLWLKASEFARWWIIKERKLLNRRNLKRDFQVLFVFHINVHKKKLCSKTKSVFFKGFLIILKISYLLMSFLNSVIIVRVLTFQTSAKVTERLHYIILLFFR